MKKNLQRIVDNQIGDCFRACLTSILDVNNDPRLPNLDDPEGWLKWDKILGEMGMGLSYSTTAFWKDGYWIASVPSLNFEGCTHAIVMYGTEVYHDPSLKKTYVTGKTLLGDKVALGGHYLEVLDVSLLWKYEAFRNEYGQ